MCLNSIFTIGLIMIRFFSFVLPKMSKELSDMSDPCWYCHRDVCWKARGPVRTYKPITEYPSVIPSTRRASRIIGIPMGPVTSEALTGRQARAPVYTSYITRYYLSENHAACKPYLLQLTTRQSLVDHLIIYLEQPLQSSSYLSQ